MALIVEDGTAKVDAESYASVAEADARLASLGMTIWAPLDPEEKEQALRRACVYMEQCYQTLWIGTRYTSTQALSWPRVDAYVYDTLLLFTSVPVAIRNANIDLALKAAAGDLNPDLGGEFPVKMKKIGPIEKEFDTTGSQVKSYRAVAMMLRPYLRVGGNRVIR